MKKPINSRASMTTDWQIIDTFWYCLKFWFETFNENINKRYSFCTSKCLKVSKNKAYICIIRQKYIELNILPEL